MPKITKTYCDMCGDEISGVRTMLISTGTASKTTVEHTIEIDLKVTRQGPVNSVSEPVGTMPHDEICFSCYYKIIQEYARLTLFRSFPKEPSPHANYTSL